jgi:hypothetical protein
MGMQVKCECKEGEEGVGVKARGAFFLGWVKHLIAIFLNAKKIFN